MIDLTDPAIRASLIDLGWTPPNPHTIEAIPTVAWQHPARADLVTSDPNAYTNLSAGKPPELVRKDAVYDRIDWLEHGVDEWRAYAVAAGKQLKAARVDTQMLDWLDSQGVEGMPWVARPSTTGRGYRLHQDSDGTAPSVREAIVDAMQK